MDGGDGIEGAGAKFRDGISTDQRLVMLAGMDNVVGSGTEESAIEDFCQM